MNKLKLFSVGNWKDFNYYVFEKKNETIDVLAKLFVNVFELEMFLYSDCEKTGSHEKINFENRIDVHEGMVDDDSRVDIFYSDKKIFVTINCPEKLRLEFNQKLGEFFEMDEPSEVKDE